MLIMYSSKDDICYEISILIVNHMSQIALTNIFWSCEAAAASPWWRYQWEHFPRYWPFVRGIHRWPVDSRHKGQWRALMFSWICTWTNGWANNRDAGDLRRHRAHYDVIVMPLRNVIVTMCRRFSSFILIMYLCCTCVKRPRYYIKPLIAMKIIDHTQFQRNSK